MNSLNYNTQDGRDWTRVDLVLALYTAAIGHIDAAISAGDDRQAELESRNKAVKIILQIRAGLDFSYGEIPKNVSRLCEFVQHTLLTGDAAQLADAKNVLVSLKEGFEGIRPEAIQLERSGEIPPLDHWASVEISL